MLLYPVEVLLNASYSLCTYFYTISKDHYGYNNNTAAG